MGDNWFDEMVARRSAEIARQDAEERLRREAYARETAAAWERLKAFPPLLIQQLRQRSGMLPMMPPANPLRQYINGAPLPRRDNVQDTPPPMIGVRG